MEKRRRRQREPSAPGGVAPSRAWRGAAMVLGAAALWGTLGIFAKRLYAAGLTPLELSSVRAGVALVGLALCLLPRPGRFRIRLADVPFFAAYGVVSIALFQYLYFAAVARTTVSVAVALLYTAPAFVVLLSWLLAGERMGRRKLGSLALVLCGVFLVTGALRLLATGQAAVSASALALGLGSGLTYGLYTLFGKRALGRYDPVQTVFFAFFFGALAVGVAVPPWRPMLAHPEALAELLAIGLLPTLASYLLYIGGLRHLPSGTASMLASLEPVVAALLGFTLLHEAMGADQVAGIALIIGAALLLARNSAPSGEGSAAQGAAASTSTTSQTPA